MYDTIFNIKAYFDDNGGLMGKLFNKFVRHIMQKYDGNNLAQETNNKDGKPFVCDEALKAYSRQAAAEGSILLKNDGVLPIAKGEKIAVFGRCALDYFCVGYGSGGDVCYPYTVNLIDGLKNGGADLDEKLLSVYKEWCKKNEADPGFWGHWPRFFPEMKVSDKLVKEAAARNDVAIVVIGRAAGEDRENVLKEGSFFLTKLEEALLAKVTANFKKVAVVLDIGNVIDFGFIEKYNVGAVLLPWQGGMESGNAVADVLLGKVCPSGKLPATIAKKYEYYPSADNFGGKEFNNYAEDIFVGYRYFDTFAKNKAAYFFGYGLSYTTFDKTLLGFERDGLSCKARVLVKNTGNRPSKDVTLVYIGAPNGLLGKADKVLAAFAKTRTLEPDEEQILEINFSLKDVASYDDGGVTGNKSCFVLEGGEYSVYIGDDVSVAEKVASFTLDELVVTERLSEVMAVADTFDRMVAKESAGKKTLAFEATPKRTVDLKERILSHLPEEIPYTGDKGIKLVDVKNGKNTLDEFVAQLSDDELELLTRGQGQMNSPYGPTGNAGAFSGIAKSLNEKGIPAVITTDGPSGIRLKMTSSLLPCGTLIASTFDTELFEKMAKHFGDEMLERGTDVILAPGMNIHRNPLCGRNFEYYSEDPLLSGKMAAAFIRGVQHDGLSACPKHFACNNQETRRNFNDSRVSERALREIYLKNFEICVKEGKPKNIMTSYNKINGVWSHYNFDLVSTVLRDEWGYTGNVITDWWMQYAPSPEFPTMSGSAYRVRARVDVLMPGATSAMYRKEDIPDPTLLETLGKEGGITRGEIQLVAKDVLSFTLESVAMTRA